MLPIPASASGPSFPQPVAFDTISRGLRSRSTSYVSPSRSRTPGRMLLWKMSAVSTSVRKVSLPRGCLRSRQIPRLFRFRCWKYGLSPFGASPPPPARPGSGESGPSILITSAPMSASIADAYVPLLEHATRNVEHPHPHEWQAVRRVRIRRRLRRLRRVLDLGQFGGRRRPAAVAVR